MANHREKIGISGSPLDIQEGLDFFEINNFILEIDEINYWCSNRLEVNISCPENDEINNAATVPDCTRRRSPKTHDLKISLASLGHLGVLCRFVTLRIFICHLPLRSCRLSNFKLKNSHVALSNLRNSLVALSNLSIRTPVSYQGA